MKIPLFTVVLLICFAISAAAQNPKIHIDNLDRLFSEATETVDVTIDGSLLQVAARFLNANKPDEAKVRELLAQLKGVYVKSFEFDRDAAYSATDIDSIRSQLSSPGWSKIATVRSKRSGDNVDVHIMLDGGLISGVGVLVAEPRRLTVVNVVGPIDPEKISQLGLLEGRLGIPRLDMDWNSVRKSNKE
jgi:hypothetical protein